MMRIVGRKLGLLLLLPAALLLTAWDTRVIKGDTWRSAYFGGESKSLPEHSTISDMALDSLGVGDLFGIRGEAQATLVDINATWFRPDKMNGLPREGDNRKTAVEERLLPPPAQFSGLPDYSYGLADWFNKNTTCPVGGGPEDLAACHDFAGWMGALNSVHFGTQARRMYARYHEIALQRALRARTLRESMSLIEQDRYGAVLREAELQALVYEAYAQHFLQDRWAIGHMWERWNGPDIPSAGHRTMTPGLAIGAIAGLIHGAESVINDDRVRRRPYVIASARGDGGPSDALPTRFRPARAACSGNRRRTLGGHAAGSIRRRLRRTEGRRSTRRRHTDGGHAGMFQGGLGGSHQDIRPRAERWLRSP